MFSTPEGPRSCSTLPVSVLKKVGSTWKPPPLMSAGELNVADIPLLTSGEFGRRLVGVPVEAEHGGLGLRRDGCPRSRGRGPQ